MVTHWFILGLLGGAIFGAVNGAGLLWLLKKPLVVDSSSHKKRSLLSVISLDHNTNLDFQPASCPLSIQDWLDLVFR